MPKVRLNYDGWLALPAAVRKKLGLHTGHQLELELVGGAIVLRPPGSAGAAPAEPAPAAQREAEAAEPAPSAAASSSLRKGPGRPRKVPAVDAPAGEPAEPVPAVSRG